MATLQIVCVLESVQFHIVDENPFMNLPENNAYQLLLVEE